MATAVRVRFPPSAPARHQGLWQVAATLSFLLFRAVQQAHPVPCFSCLYEFGSNRWYKRCLKCHPLPLLPLTRTALATPTQQPVVPAIIFFAWAASSMFVVLCLLLPKNVLLFLWSQDNRGCRASTPHYSEPRTARYWGATNLRNIPSETSCPQAATI